MAQLPKFKPQDTPLANYQAGATNWSFLTFKYGKPLGPDQKQYGPYYTYTLDVYINGNHITHRWYAEVDDHRTLQLAGVADGAKMAVTYVVDGKSKGLVAMHQGGPRVERSEEEVDMIINKELYDLQTPTAQQGPVSNVILPPQPPQFPPPPIAPAPPTPPQPQQAQPQAVVPPAPPPAKPLAAAPPPPPGNGYQNGNGGGYEAPVQKVYYPLKDDEDYNAMMDVVLADADNLRKKSLDIAMKSLAEYFPAKPTNAQKVEMLRLAIDYSAPLNMYLKDKTWHMWLKPGEMWVLAKPGEKPPEPEKPLEPDTKDNALILVKRLHPDNYAKPEQALIKDWLSYVATPADNIKSWKHAANIAKILGLDKKVIVNEFDVDHLVTLTKAIWLYEDAKNELDSRNGALDLVAKEHGLPKELMLYLDDDNDPDEEDE